MLIPVRRSLHDGLDDGVDALKPASFEGQAAQLLPPGLDQVQPAGLRRDEQHGDLGPCDQRGLCLPREVCAQIISDQHPLPCGRGLQHLLQELALSRCGLHRVVANPVAGSKAPNTHTLPRRP